MATKKTTKSSQVSEAKKSKAPIFFGTLISVFVVVGVAMAMTGKGQVALEIGSIDTEIESGLLLGSVEVDAEDVAIENEAENVGGSPEENIVPSNDTLPELGEVIVNEDPNFVIIDIKATDITLTTANISWTTYVESDSLLKFGALSSEKEILGNSNLSTEHLFVLSGLTPETTYEFRGQSRDTRGNFTDSENFQFTTLPKSSDTFIPLLQEIFVVDITDSEARIIWRTNEIATGKIYVSSKTPFDLNSVPTLGSTVLKEEHSFNLKKLPPKTKFYFILESKDAAGNVGRSIESNFQTLDK
jgi:hypothetical protein